MKKLIITTASLLIVVEHIVAGAGVVVVSNPGQSPGGGFITTKDIVPFVNVALTASNTSDQAVYLTVQQSGAASNIDLFAGSVSNKLTGMQVVLGPFIVQPGQTNNVVVSARVNSVKATNSLPVSVRLELTAVSNLTPDVTLQGVLPIQGTTYVVGDPRGRLTSIQLFYKYSGSPLDTNGVPLDLLFLEGQGSPSIAYGIEYSTNMLTWSPLLSPGYPNWDGRILVYVFMRLPPHCYYRLKSSYP